MSWIEIIGILALIIFGGSYLIPIITKYLPTNVADNQAVNLTELISRYVHWKALKEDALIQKTPEALALLEQLKQYIVKLD